MVSVSDKLLTSTDEVLIPPGKLVGRQRGRDGERRETHGKWSGTHREMLSGENLAQNIVNNY